MTNMSEAAELSSAGPDRNADEPVNVLIVGVGGQGVIMVSKVLATLAHEEGLQVKQSEVQGMAKRGGSVYSHLRMGKQVWSPTIAKGEADVLLALEWAEGLRWLPYLRPERGTFICDTKRIVPPFACLNRRRGAPLRYSRETPAEVLEHVAEAYAIDASRIAEALGNERAGNTVLLGALSTAMDFPSADWERVLAQLVPPKTVALNLEAFRRGRRWIEEARTTPPDSLASPEISAAPAVKGSTTLEITPDWCKSCDICVKICPERCLRLNAERVVELTDAAKCTGCRLCEWLCPDFAIRVRIDEVSQ